jgi:hypothetical protein
VETAFAQHPRFRERHQVKRKETIFGIARMYDISIQELIAANPEMNEPGYELKKGDYINIPWSKNQPQTNMQQTTANPTTSEIAMPAKTQKEEVDVRNREIRVGVMLPLHKINGDGKRMLEYYRGVLMACDSLRHNGISTDISAWNVAEDTDINTFLQDPRAAQCDVIIGPLYTKMVKPLADFATEHDIRVFIPFSINSHEVLVNRNVFQVYQPQTEQN